MTTATASSLVEVGRANLDLARRQTLKLVADMTDAQLLHRPSPTGNHPLWILTHIAYADAGFLAGLSGKPPVIGDETWGAKYGMKSKPVDDAKQYPKRAELLKLLDKARTAMLDWIASLDEATLLDELPEGFRTFGPNYASIPGALAWHEGFHAGQISAVRRSLGLPYTMG